VCEVTLTVQGFSQTGKESLSKNKLGITSLCSRTFWRAVFLTETSSQKPVIDGYQTTHLLHKDFRGCIAQWKQHDEKGQVSTVSSFNLRFLEGDSELAKQFRAKDWSSHPLGPAELWATELKIAVSLMLNSKFPTYIAWGKERSFLYNDAYIQMLSGKHPKAVGEKLEVIWSEIWDKAVFLIEKVESGEAVYHEDMNFLIERHGCLEEVYVTFSMSPLQNLDAEIVGIFCSAVETTQRKVAIEAALSERRIHEEVLNQTAIPIALLEGPKYQFTFTNPAYDQMFGFETSPKGRNALEVFPDAVEQGFEVLLTSVYKTGLCFTGKEMHYQQVLPNGTKRDFYLDITYAAKRNASGKIQGVLAALIDVTESVLAKQSLENSQHELAQFVALAPMPMVILRGPQHVYSLVNSAFDLLVGNNVLGKSLREAHGNDADELSIHLDRVFQSGEPYVSKETPYTSTGEDGHARTMFFNQWFSPFRDKHGKVAGILGIAQDVTEQVVARRAVEQERERLYSAFMDAPGAVSVLRGPELRFEFANRIYREIVGIERPLDGRPLKDVYPEMDPEMVTLIKTVYETGKPFISEELPVGLDYYQNGQIVERYWNNVIQPIFDSEGKVDGVMSCAYEVTEQVRARKKLLEAAKSLEESELRLNNALRAGKMGSWEIKIPEGILVGDENFRRFHHVPKHEDFRQATERLGHPDDQKRIKEALENSMQHGVPYFCEYRVKTSDGSFKWVAARGEPSYNEKNEIISIRGVAFEIEEQKQNEFALQKAKEDAEIANATKSAFLANMSHEIRTPLGAILGYADLMKDPTLSPQERSQFLDTVSRNGKALIRIIDDILDLAKVESGKLDVENVEFHFLDLIDEVMDLFRERARAKDLYFRLNLSDEVPDVIRSDPTRIRQILINIIGNAIKFTHEGGVTVHIKTQPAGAGKFEFRILVRDTGTGISPECRAKLFQPFTQADNTMTRKFGGTGLGLALSWRLAEALGGEIRIEDCNKGEDQGCTFVITFCAQIPTLSESKSNAKKKSQSALTGEDLPLKGIRVLLADDARDNRFLVTRLLVKNGAHVETADNGRDALNLALQGNYDLVLMDLQMPEMDGYEATKSLLESGYKKPIIALTAHAMAEERSKTEAAGFAGHLTKPLITSELIKTVASFQRILH
jgi:signal transduction histidine kinase